MYINSENDEGSEYIRGMLELEGVDAVISRHMGLSLKSKSAQYIKSYYKMLCGCKNLENVLAAAQNYEAEYLNTKKIV